jgi:hypothetical protein
MCLNMVVASTATLRRVGVKRRAGGGEARVKPG